MHLRAPAPPVLAPSLMATFSQLMSGAWPGLTMRAPAVGSHPAPVCLSITARPGAAACEYRAVCAEYARRPAQINHTRLAGHVKTPSLRAPPPDARRRRPVGGRGWGGRKGRGGGKGGVRVSRSTTQVEGIVKVALNC